MKIIIVLGNRLLPTGKITNILKKRLDKAIELYKENDIFLLSGGNYANIYYKNVKIYHTESFEMKKYILNKLPNANILCESRSLNTEENIKYCYQIVKNADCNILLISCKEHLTKVKNIINKMSKDINWKLIHSNILQNKV